LLVDGTRDYAIFMRDPAGQVLTWNAGAQRFKGDRAEELVGSHFSRFYPPDALARGLPGHELELAQRGGSFEDEGWRVRKDGSLFRANVVITAMRGPQGDLLGCSKLTRHLTPGRRFEPIELAGEERELILDAKRTDDGPARDPRQGRIPGDAVARTPHAAQRDPRVDADPAAGRVGRRRGSATGRRGHGPECPRPGPIDRRRRQPPAADRLEPVDERHQVHALEAAASRCPCSASTRTSN
jgi:PAS domain S-box-containing protein